jgi:protein TonB
MLASITGSEHDETMPCLHAGLAPAFFIRVHSFGMQRLTSLLLALALHAAILWGLWQHRLIPAPGEAMTLFVDFIAPPAPENPLPPLPKIVKPKPVAPPAPRLVAETPVVAPTDYVAPPPRPEPAPRIEAPAIPPAPPAPPAPLPAGPVTLGEDHSVAAPSAARLPIRRSRGGSARKARRCCAWNSTRRAASCMPKSRLRTALHGSTRRRSRP